MRTGGYDEYPDSIARACTRRVAIEVWRHDDDWAYPHTILKYPVPYIMNEYINNTSPNRRRNVCLSNYPVGSRSNQLQVSEVRNSLRPIGIATLQTGF